MQILRRRSNSPKLDKPVCKLYNITVQNQSNTAEVKMEQLLLKACQNGQKGVVIAFLKKDGINVDAVDGAGLSPLQ